MALPLKTQAAIAIGKVEGEYEFKEIADNIKHIRRVKWLKTIPRSAFDQDILYSFGSLLTVCQIERNDAENRVKKLLQGVELELPEEAKEIIDTGEYAKDQIVKYISYA